MVFIFGLLSRKNLELILEFTINDFKLKYKSNIFGYLWSFLNPLLMLASLYIVFSYVMKLNVPNYQLFLLLGIIIWNYFSEATSGSISSLITNAGIFKKHKINSSVVVISACTSSLLTLFFSFIAFFGIIAITGMAIKTFSSILILYLLMLFAFTSGTSLIITSLYIHFKDIKHIWTFLLLIGFWFSPIIYSETTIPNNLRPIYMINPIARIISHTRNIFIYNYIDSLEQILITSILCLSIFFLGLFLFSRLSKNIGEKL